MSMLEVKDLQVYYGVIQALKGISFHVEQGEVIALIGANGAGKTTAFNCITGVYEPTNGRISFLGEPIVENHPHFRFMPFELVEGRNGYIHSGRGLAAGEEWAEKRQNNECRFFHLLG